MLILWYFQWWFSVSSPTLNVLKQYLKDFVENVLLNLCGHLSYDCAVIMPINGVRTFLQNIYTWYHNPEDHSMNLQGLVILVKSTKVTTWPPQNWNDFLWDCSLSGDKYSCHIRLLYGHWNFKSRHTKLLKSSFLATSSYIKSSITETYYGHFKANEMPFQVTYYNNVLSTIMFSRDSSLTFECPEHIYQNMFLFN